MTPWAAFLQAGLSSPRTSASSSAFDPEQAEFCSAFGFPVTSAPLWLPCPQTCSMRLSHRKTCQQEENHPEFGIVGALGCVWTLPARRPVPKAPLRTVPGFLCPPQACWERWSCGADEMIDFFQEPSEAVDEDEATSVLPGRTEQSCAHRVSGSKVRGQATLAACGMLSCFLGEEEEETPAAGQPLMNLLPAPKGEPGDAVWVSRAACVLELSASAPELQARLRLHPFFPPSLCKSSSKLRGVSSCPFASPPDGDGDGVGVQPGPWVPVAPPGGCSTPPAPRRVLT